MQHPSPQRRLQRALALAACASLLAGLSGPASAADAQPKAASASQPTAKKPKAKAAVDANACTTSGSPTGSKDDGGNNPEAKKPSGPRCPIAIMKKAAVVAQ